jgi:hypothetical protein
MQIIIEFCIINSCTYSNFRPILGFLHVGDFANHEASGILVLMILKVLFMVFMILVV